MEVEIENLCRICLDESDVSSSIKEIFIGDAELLKVLQHICYSIDWQNIDEFPNKVCSKCLYILKGAHFLNEKSIESDSRLRAFANDELIVKEEYLEPEDVQIIVCETKKDPEPEEEEEESKAVTITQLDEQQEFAIKNVTSLSHRKRIHECPQCSRQFDRASRLERHVQNDHNCYVCIEKFRNKEERDAHLKNHDESELKVARRKMSKKFASQIEYEELITDEVLLRPYMCDVCNKSFKDISRMREHIRSHTTEKPFQCTECEKSFATKPNLRQHLKTHLNLKEFHCQLCPAQLSSKGALKGHMRSHLNIKPYQCSICGAQFTKGNSMRKHVRAVHEKIKPYECEYCTMKFSTTDHLRRHTRTHTGDRPYVCNFPNCTRAYAQSNDLIKHKRVCHNDLLNKCTLCTESFRLLGELRNHYSSVHYPNTEIDDISLLPVR